MTARTVPTSADAEQGILGSAMLDPSRTLQACVEGGITKSHFYFPGHQIVFATLLEFWQDNEPIDLITLTAVIRDRGQINQCGGVIRGQPSTGAAFLTELQVLLPTASNAEFYIDIVREKATRRAIINGCDKVLFSAYDASMEDAEIFAEAESALLAIVKMKEGRKIHAREMKELVTRATAKLEAALQGDGRIDMPTGIQLLDYHTLGFRQPEVTFIAAKPSDGKSALALNFVETLSIDNGKRGGVISLEMSDDQCAERLLAARAAVNLRAIKRDRAMSQWDMDKWANAARDIANAPIYIRDDGQLSISEIDATLSTWKAKHGLDYAIIDHAQLCRGDGKTDGRTEEVEQISRAMKPMAKRLEIALIVLSQVTEGANGSYATKNSKALQEDADNLWTISHKDGESFIHISKQRDGERNISVPVNFTPSLMRFSGKTKEQEAELLPETAKAGRRK